MDVFSRPQFNVFYNPGSRDSKVEHGIPEDHSAIAPIIVGTPAGNGRPAERKPAAVLAWR